MYDFKTDISVLTNISEAHTDFHGTYELYKEAKKKIFNHHTKDNVAIINKGNEESLILTSDIPDRKLYFSSKDKTDCYIKDNSIYYLNEIVVNIKDIRIKGIHNLENIMAMILVAKEFNINNEIIVDFLKSFSGVEHRIEFVKSINGVNFYNDSKATNNISTITALKSFKENVLLIMGGQERNQNFFELENYLNRVKKIYCYGENKGNIRNMAKKLNIDCSVLNNLNEATNLAYKESINNDTILLSPASASWDQYDNFEIRGNEFKQIVNNLK